MTKKEFAKEIGMVAAIMADSIFEKLYEVCHQNGSGYISTAEIISGWAVEFVLKHEKTDWEEMLAKGIEPQSKEIKSVICWDDCIFDHAHFNLEQMKK